MALTANLQINQGFIFVPRYGRLKNIAQIIKHEYGCENMNDDELEKLSIIANV